MEQALKTVLKVPCRKTASVCLFLYHLMCSECLDYGRERQSLPPQGVQIYCRIHQNSIRLVNRLSVYLFITLVVLFQLKDDIYGIGSNSSKTEVLGR